MSNPIVDGTSWAAVAHAVAQGLEVTADDVVSVFLTDAGSLDIVAAFCEEVYKRGAEPHVILTDERIDRIALATASIDSLAKIPMIEAESIRKSTVHVSFRGMVPPPNDPITVNPGAGLGERLAAQRKGKGLISAMRWETTRWAIVRVPTQEWARFRGLDVDVLFEEFFQGCLLDWDTVTPAWNELAHRIDGTEVVRIVSPDTDLSLRVAGRTSVVFAGEANWPDGEVATAPLDDGVDGFITFPEPFYFASQLVQNLRLEFTRGIVTGLSADVGEDIVTALLDTDEGSRRVGELGIGLNASMQTMTGDLFFDEKILGTVHLALGRAYPQCGGTNQSSLHWDIVKDLRATSAGGAGTVFLDDVAILQDGQPLW